MVSKLVLINIIVRARFIKVFCSRLMFEKIMAKATNMHPYKAKIPSMLVVEVNKLINKKNIDAVSKILTIIIGVINVEGF